MFYANANGVLNQVVSQHEVHDTQLSSCSDACFMTTRAGQSYYDRTFMEGFVRPHSGGELLTKPLTFDGKELEINYSTSAAGSLRVEILNENGQPIPGFTLDDADDVFGNRIEGRARWDGASSLAGLNDQSIRLRFVMRDADLYSFTFVE